MILTDMTNKKDAQHWGCASLSTVSTVRLRKVISPALSFRQSHKCLVEDLRWKWFPGEPAGL